MIVTLSPSRLENAIEIGIGRQRNNEEKNFPTKFSGHVGDPLYKHVVGSIGTEAVSMATGLKRVGVKPGPHRGSEVGDYWVFSTHHANGHLLIQKSRPDDSLWVFVIVLDVQAGVCNIVGTIVAGDAKQHREWWREEGEMGATSSAYFVPQVALRPWGDACPVCGGPFYTRNLGETKLYVCANGCTGRRIASRLGERLAGGSSGR